MHIAQIEGIETAGMRPAAAVAGPAPAHFITLCGQAGFQQLYPLWRSLFERTVAPRYMQHPDWYRALFVSGLANPGDFMFTAVHTGQGLAAVIPLARGRQAIPGLGGARRLGLCNHPHMDLADILVADPAAHRGLMGELVAWLAEERPAAWDMLCFEKVPDRSALRRALDGQTLPGAISSRRGVSAYLDTASEASALGAVSRSFRHNLRRLARRAEARAPLRLEVCLDPRELAPALAALLALESSGWKGAGGSAIAHHPSLVTFYRSLAEDFGRRGQCVIALLHHGDRPVAAQFGLIAGGAFNILKIAYSEADAAIAPGHLLMERMIRWCCQRPDIGELSFVTGPAWSERWKPRHDPVRAYRIFAPTLKGCLLQGALRAKHWLRPPVHGGMPI